MAIGTSLLVAALASGSTARPAATNRMVPTLYEAGHFYAVPPKLEIAGWSVDPVWFTERPDPAFHDMMSDMTEKRIEGAIGGNVFRHFLMTVDYPHGNAWFRCASGCKPVLKPPPVP